MIRNWKACLMSIGLIVLLAMVLVSRETVASSSAPKGVNTVDGTCDINSSYWGTGKLGDFDSDIGITLPIALRYARGDGGYKACFNGINLKTNVTIKSPIVIDFASTNGSIVIDGGGHTLDASQVNMDKNAAFDKKDNNGCLIRVQSGDVVIKNLTITGPGSNKPNGICLENSDAVIGYNSVKKTEEPVALSNVKDGVMISGSNNNLVNVSIDLAEGGGVHLTGNATGNRILPNSTINQAQYGIWDESQGESSNMFIATNRAIKKDDSGQEVVDENGIITLQDLVYSDSDLMGSLDSALPTTGTKEDFVLKGSSGRIVQSSRLSIPVITMIIPPTSNSGTKYRVMGQFIKFNDSSTFEHDSTTSGVQPYDCRSSTNDTNISRLAIFNVSGADASFAGYVGKGQNGILNTSNAMFIFDIDKANIGKFSLVPLDSAYAMVGRSSNYKALAMNMVGDCTADSIDEQGNILNGAPTSSEDTGGPTGTGSGTGPNGGWEGLATNQASRIQYVTEQECNANHNFRGGCWDGMTKDSDMDGIPDCIEMGVVWEDIDTNTTDTTNALTKDSKPLAAGWVYDPDKSSCACDKTTLTCWHMPDSDSDGLKDGVDGLDAQFVIGAVLNSTKSKVAIGKFVYTANTAAHSSILVVPSKVASTSRNDAVARMNDSDGDGLKDGQEDRTRILNSQQALGLPSYFFTDDGNPTELQDASKNPIPCNLGANVDIGVSYGLYVVGGNLAKPVLLTSKSQISGGAIINSLQCRNEAASSSLDFNGQYDSSRGETDTLNKDTDNDTFQDGADNCPEKYSINSNCSPDCIDGESTFLLKYTTTPSTYVNVSGNRVTLISDPNTGRTKLFEKTVTDSSGTHPDYQFVKSVCITDMDKDGIPDCVENPTGSCVLSGAQGHTGSATCSAASVTMLNAYNKDSDCDAIPDTLDVCPFTPSTGDGDRFDENRIRNNHQGYSCDPKMIYVNQTITDKIFACYVDRDGDGMWDCVEDKNLDGKVDPYQQYDYKDIEKIKAAIPLIESDPLDTDTDGDEIVDYDEIVGWPIATNPQSDDTDQDGFKDQQEDRDSDKLISLISDMSAQGCIAGDKKDTNPTKWDTDSDGLSDGMEAIGSHIPDGDFIALIGDPVVWQKGGVELGSNPNAKDSDGDGLLDGQEYNGKIVMYENSNPCMKDSDGDTIQDKEEKKGCALNADLNCVGSADGPTGIDSDSDGLPDSKEAMLNTLPNDPDTDRDGRKDGEEDFNHNGIIERNLGDTDPLKADTDSDGLNDGMEVMYGGTGTDPNVADTDGDCISDGLEDANKNGKWDASETNALDADTDKDGLPDGYLRGIGEDLNCNGLRDKDGNLNFTETDPTNPDSDSDGNKDYDEMFDGGMFNIANMDRATRGAGSSCQLTTTADGSGVNIMIVMMIGLAGLVTVRVRKLGVVSK